MKENTIKELNNQSVYKMQGENSQLEEHDTVRMPVWATTILSNKKTIKTSCKDVNCYLRVI